MKWPSVNLSELLTQRFEERPIVDATKETFVTVRLYGKGAIPREISEGKEPVMRSGYLLRKGDLVYSRIDARNGAFAIVPSELEGAVVSKDFPCFEFSLGKVVPEFLMNVLGSSWFYQQLGSSSFGTTNRQRIGEESLLARSIPLPSIVEQRRILSIVDEAITLEGLRTRSNSLVMSLIHSLFEKTFKKSKGRKLALGDLTSMVTSGSTPRGGDEVYVGSGPYFLRSQNVRMNELVLNGAVCLPKEVHEQMRRTKVLEGDVLLNLTGASIGRVTWVPKLDREANISQHVCLIRPIKERLNPVYLSAFISLPYTQSHILQVQAGASRQAINHQQVRQLEIPLPEIEIQNEFSERIRELSEVRGFQIKSKQVLGSLKEAIMFDALRA